MNKKSGASSVLKTVGLMAIIILLAKFMGLLRETLIANIYGQGYSSDILNTATQIPLLFFDMTLGVAILSTFVPIFNKYLETEGRKRAMEFASSFISFACLLALIFASIGMIFSKQIVRLMVPGYGAEKVVETARLLRVLFPSIVFTALAYVCVGLLQSFGEFNIPSLISFVSNFIMILYLMVFGKRFGLMGVIISMVIAWGMQLVIQIPALKKKDAIPRFKLNFKDEGLKDAAILAIPVLISSWVQPVCAVINMSFGSSLGDGAVSGLNWANKIYIIMVGVFAYAVTNYVFPRLSRLSAGGKDDVFGETTRQSLSYTIFVIAYVAAMFIALSKPIIKVVFERGAFTSENTYLTATALFFYSFGMIGYAICEILNKSFYALKDGKIPMMASIFGIGVNFISAFLFVRVLELKVGGLALSSAVSSSFIAGILLIMINKRKNGTVTKDFLVNGFKMVACATLSAIVSAYIYKTVQNALSDGMIFTLIKLVVSAFFGLVVYILGAILLKVNEISFLRRGKSDE